REGQHKVKYAKTAAIVAGSLMAIGAAAPAFAAGPQPPHALPPASSSTLSNVLHARPLDGQRLAPLVKTVKGAAQKVQGGKKILLHGNKIGSSTPKSLLGEGLSIGQ